jgi:hypothetical protein
MLEQVSSTTSTTTRPLSNEHTSKLVGLYQALQLCPEACQLLLQTTPPSITNNSETTDRSQNKRRSPKFRSSSKAQDADMSYSNLYQQMQNPLWSPLLAHPPVHQAPVLQQSTVKRFWELLSRDFVCNTLETSLQSLKMLQFLLACCDTTDGTCPWCTQDLVTKLLTLWHQVTLCLVKKMTATLRVLNPH